MSLAVKGVLAYSRPVLVENERGLEQEINEMPLCVVI